MAQEDFFLDLGDIKGESQDADLKDQIHITSFSFGVSNSGTGGINMGSGASKVNVQDLHLTKMMDKSSPNLFGACASGKHIPTGKLTVRRAGGDAPETYLTYEMTEVFVSSHTVSGAEGGGLAQESVSLNFSKIKMTYTQQSATGGKGTDIPKTLDIKANKVT